MKETNGDGMTCNFEIWSWWYYRDLHMMTYFVIYLTNMSNLGKLSIYLGPLSHFNNLFLNFFFTVYILIF